MRIAAGGVVRFSLRAGVVLFAVCLLTPARARAAEGMTSADAPPPVTWVRHPARPFAVSATEVTVAQFRACVVAGACDAATVNAECNYGRADRADHPVNCVTYHGAEQYCTHVGGRLCTETEWLDACRGTDGRAFPYGTTFDAEACNARSATATPAGDPRPGTAPVASHPSCKGGLSGLFDMAGNVAEWVESCSGTYCKFRGAGYISNDPVDLFAGCSGVCSGNDKGFQSGVVGIRCCRSEAP
jgi:formylglycine-generating enzyme required for sulfatase activity